MRGTWMKEEASHHGVGWNWVGDWEKGGRQRAWGSVYERKKRGDYRRNFCETEALASSTCLDIVLTTMPTPKAMMMRFMSCTCWDMYLHPRNFAVALFLLWFSSTCSVAANRTEFIWDGHIKNTRMLFCCPVQQHCNKYCEVDTV